MQNEYFQTNLQHHFICAEEPKLCTEGVHECAEQLPGCAERVSLRAEAIFSREEQLPKCAERVTERAEHIPKRAEGVTECAEALPHHAGVCSLKCVKVVGSIQ